jgi:hypothetical protein
MHHGGTLGVLFVLKNIAAAHAAETSAASHTVRY